MSFRPLPDHAIVNRFLVQNALPKLVEIQRCPAGIGSIREQRKTSCIFERECEGHVDADFLTLLEQNMVHFFKLFVRGLLSVTTKGNVLNTATEAQFQKNRHSDGTPLSHHNAWVQTLGNITGIQLFRLDQFSHKMGFDRLRLMFCVTCQKKGHTQCWVAHLWFFR